MLILLDGAGQADADVIRIVETVANKAVGGAFFSGPAHLGSGGHSRRQNGVPGNVLLAFATAF